MDDFTSPKTLEDFDKFLEQNTFGVCTPSRVFNIEKKGPFNYRLYDSSKLGGTPYTDLSALMVQMLMEMSKDE